MDRACEVEWWGHTFGRDGRAFPSLRSAGPGRLCVRKNVGLTPCLGIVQIGPAHQFPDQSRPYPLWQLHVVPQS